VNDLLLMGAATPAAESARPVDDWKHLAACKGADPDLFFPDINGSSRRAYREAERICRACQVRQQCLDDALASDDRWGMRGGVTPRTRARMRRAAEAAENFQRLDEVAAEAARARRAS
jgi:WhiB family redox-sensing transcriptional regulator